jgi:hypothetical protein
MGGFLDLRVSENSSTFGSPNTAVATTPQLAGVIGLQTQGVAGLGSNGMIVNLMGTVGAQAPRGGDATIVLNVQRGSVSFGAGAIIYTAEHRVAQTNVITFNAIDLNAPAAAETVYALFVSAISPTVDGVVVTRTGPEVFSGMAQNGLAPTP